jgi:hypothetical protein
MNSNLMPWKTLAATLELGMANDGWNLAEVTPEGVEFPRVFGFDVAFDTPFGATPVIHIGLTGFDMDQRDSGRISLKATEISSSGFRMEISTWLETRIYGVECSWLAIGSA